MQKLKRCPFCASEPECASELTIFSITVTLKCRYCQASIVEIGIFEQPLSQFTGLESFTKSMIDKIDGLDSKLKETVFYKWNKRITCKN